ncbi:MAG: hypothetical protein ACRC9R_07985 [Enterovibrio sp.]
MPEKQKKGAMAKDPEKYTRVSPGIYRDSKGKLVQRGASAPTQGAKKPRRDRTPGVPGAPAGSDEAKFRNMPGTKQREELSEDVGAFANRMFGNAMQFDPNQPFVGYEQPFSQEMGRARESVMGEFERTMAPEFARQDMAFQQRMTEQGIDPNSEAYQAQFRAMKETQGGARQAAMSQAFQLGGQYQQQGFEQGMQASMLPFQQYQATENLWALPYRTEAEAYQAELNRQAQITAARMGGGSSVTAAQINAQAARDVAAMEMAQQWGNQPKQPNPWNAAISGAASGAAGALVNKYGS